MWFIKTCDLDRDRILTNIMNSNRSQGYDKEPEELVIIVDDENQEQMVVTRSIMRKQNLTHRSSFTAVLNSARNILVLQRSQNKDLYPGMYEIACAGVVHPYESFEECAQRELQEELGVKRPPLTFLDLFFDESEENRVWGAVYQILWDGELRFDEREVAWGTFLDFKEVESLILQGKCTPESSFILEILLNQVAVDK